MIVKCTMLFSLATNTSGQSLGRRIGGWSESVYDNTDNINTTQRTFALLCQARAGMLPVGAAVIGQRYQIVNPVGGTTTTKRVFPGTIAPADVPQMAAQFSCPGVGVPNVRLFTLRGMPDANVVEGEFKPTPEYLAAFNLFKNRLRNWYFRGRALTNLEVPIVSISSAGVFVLGAALTFDELNKIRIFKAKETSFDTTISGLFTVLTKTSSTGGTFANWTHGNRVDGTCRVDGVIYPQIQALQASDITVTVRKVGRPFNQYRGRASARA